MALRMASYMLRIWERHVQTASTSTLPFIFPLVLYHGRRSWRQPLDLAQLIDVPSSLLGDLRVWVPSWSFRLFDLSRLAEEHIKGMALGQMVQHVFRLHDPEQNFGELARLQQTMQRMMSESGLSALRLLIAYGLRVSERLPTAQERETIKRFIEPGFEEELMTVAERLEARGRNFGRQEGLEQGRQAMAEMVQSMLTQKLGELSAPLRSAIEHADAASLKRLVEGLFQLADDKDALELLKD